MRIAVLGGGGFIGSHVAARLAVDGHDVTAVDVSFPDLRREWWERTAQRDRLDLTNPICAHVAVQRADYVLHFAADMGGVGYFHSAADGPAAATNMRIDLNIAEACHDAGVPFFYSSSACAYSTGGQQHGGGSCLHEGLLGLGPADRLYGEEKRFMALFCGQEPLARVGIFHTIYGPGQEHEGPRTKFPPAIAGKVKAAARSGGPIEIWGDGTQMRTFLYIDDAVDRILAVAFADDYDGPVNIGSDEEVTVRECADWLCAHAGVAADYRFDRTKPVGVRARGTDNTLFNYRYGKRPTTSARDGLARLYDWLP